ncbi:MAG: hypothetical protein R3C68_01025 [Myxococcota bacterium]
MPRPKSTHNASWSKPNRYLDIDRDLFNDRYNQHPLLYGTG